MIPVNKIIEKCPICSGKNLNLSLDGSYIVCLDCRPPQKFKIIKEGIA